MLKTPFINRTFLLYTLIAMVYVFSSPNAPYTLSPLIKASPILLLLALTFTILDGHRRAITTAALGCSALGDVFLAVEFEHRFIAGLGAFLIAHLFYMVVFVPSLNLRNSPLKILMSSLLLIYCLILAQQILPEDITLKVAVVIYISILSMMCCCAIFAVKNGVYLHVIGVLIFALSDSIIAWDAFRQPIPNASYWIMTSYYLAQAMIVFGIFQLCGYGNRSPREVTYN